MSTRHVTNNSSSMTAIQAAMEFQQAAPSEKSSVVDSFQVVPGSGSDFAQKKHVTSFSSGKNIKVYNPHSVLLSTIFKQQPILDILDDNDILDSKEGCQAVAHVLSEWRVLNKRRVKKGILLFNELPGYQKNAWTFKIINEMRIRLNPTDKQVFTFDVHNRQLMRLIKKVQTTLQSVSDEQLAHIYTAYKDAMPVEAFVGELANYRDKFTRSMSPQRMRRKALRQLFLWKIEPRDKKETLRKPNAIPVILMATIFFAMIAANVVISSSDGDAVEPHNNQQQEIDQ